MFIIEFKVETKDIEELQRAIHELEHELYPRVIDQIANKKIFFVRRGNS